jgi:hypothetical protein
MIVCFLVFTINSLTQQIDYYSIHLAEELDSAKDDSKDPISPQLNTR